MILASTAPRPNRQHGAHLVNLWAWRIAGERGIHYVDLHDPLVDGATGAIVPALTVDGIHLEEEGARIAGEAAHEQINRFHYVGELEGRTAPRTAYGEFTANGLVSCLVRGRAAVRHR